MVVSSSPLCWPMTVLLATGRSRIASTVIYYLVRSFDYLSSIIYSHVARHEKCKNFWITFICKISIAKILVPCLTVKYTCHEKFRVYGNYSNKGSEYYLLPMSAHAHTHAHTHTCTHITQTHMHSHTCV